MDCKWQFIKKSHLRFIPRKDELLFFDNLYYEVVNVIHVLDDNQDIFVVVNKFSHQDNIDNQSIIKNIEKK